MLCPARLSERERLEFEWHVGHRDENDSNMAIFATAVTIVSTVSTIIMTLSQSRQGYDCCFGLEERTSDVAAYGTATSWA